MAWLSLDAGDNDPARFWRHVVAALDRARPGIAERVGPLLGPPAPPSFEGLVTALINELAAQPGEDEVLLVLDDYHLIDAQPVHASLAFLLEHRPPGLRLVLASRSDPPLPLARLRAARAAGRAARRRPAVHRRRRRRRCCARRLGGAALPGAAVAALAARTEGWAAGLQLAALSLRGQRRCRRVRGGVHRQPPLRPGLPDRGGARAPGGAGAHASCWRPRCWSGCRGALCDAVTGRTGGQALLEQVERANLFLVPLDEVRGWWRYHHLFADLLRARLQQQQPGRVAALHRNAAAWSRRARAGRRRGAARAGRRGDDLGRPADRAAFRRGLLPARRERRRFSGGWRRCPPSWSGPAPGCCWRRRCLAARQRPRGGGRSRCSMRPSARYAGRGR